MNQKQQKAAGGYDTTRANERANEKSNKKAKKDHPKAPRVKKRSSGKVCYFTHKVLLTQSAD